jgi:hypothetical protein
LSEYLVPEEVFNPTVYMVNKAIKQRALNPSAPLPDLDPRLRANIEMLPEHRTISEGYGTTLQEILQVKAGKNDIHIYMSSFSHLFKIYSTKEESR